MSRSETTFAIILVTLVILLVMASAAFLRTEMPQMRPKPSPVRRYHGVAYNRGILPLEQRTA
jgi:hypothetical protein